MAYIPHGAIRTYMKIKQIIAMCFSDQKRYPYVTMSKLYGKITVTIRRKGEKTIMHTMRISDVDRLKRVYDELYSMAFFRR